MVNIQTRELGGERPILTKGAVVCHDIESQCVYYYGGSPWADTKKDDFFNIGRMPTANLFKLDIRTQVWQLLTPDGPGEPCLEPSIKLPFTGSTEDDDEEFITENLQNFPLPNLTDAMAAFYRDQKSRKPYLLIFGGRKGIKLESGVALQPAGKSQFLCVDLSLEVKAGHTASIHWRDINLTDSHLVSNRFGGTATILEDSKGSLLFCLFGGDVVDNKNNSSCSETYAIANLSDHIWVLPDHPMPRTVKPLGYRPHVVRLKESPGVLFLSGWSSSESRISETGPAVSFLTFDPNKRTEDAFTARNDKGLQRPMLPASSKSICSEFFPIESSERPDVKLTTAMLVEWKLKSLRTLRQRKTLSLNIMKLQARTQVNPRAEVDGNGPLSTAFEDDFEDDVSCCSLLESPNAYAGMLVNYKWREIKLDPDDLSIFNNFGSDFCGDFAVVSDFRTNAGVQSPDGFIISLVGHKKSYAWSPAITLNSVVQIVVSGEDLAGDGDDPVSDESEDLDSDSIASLGPETLQDMKDIKGVVEVIDLINDNVFHLNGFDSYDPNTLDHCQIALKENLELPVGEDVFD